MMNRIIGIWISTLMSFTITIAQPLTLTVDAPWNEGTEFVNTHEVIITGEARSTIPEDSLLNVWYRPVGAVRWEKGAWGKREKASGSFSITLQNLNEGIHEYEISVNSRKHSQVDSVFQKVSFVVDVTPPVLVKPVQMVLQVDNEINPYWELRLSFSEVLAQWNRQKLIFKVGDSEIDGGKLTDWQPVSSVTWKARIPEKILNSWMEYLTQGQSISVLAEPEALQDLAGNVNGEPQKLTLHLQSTQVFDSLKLITRGISPNGDAHRDTLRASVEVNQLSTVFLVITSVSEMNVVYKNALTVHPGDGHRTATSDSSLREVDDGRCLIQWHPSMAHTNVPDGIYLLTLYAQLPNAPGYVDFQSVAFFVDRTPPVISKLLPATGNPSHFLNPQPQFALWPDNDTSQAPTKWCRAQFTGVVDALNNELDSLTVDFHWDTLNQNFIFDFKENGYQLAPGSHTVIFELTDIAGNTGVYLHNFEVVADTASNEVIDVYNYPNPFNPFRGQMTQISFFTYLTGLIKLQIFDFTGRLVYQNTESSAAVFGQGRQIIRWDGRDLQGKIVPAGVYWGRVTVGDQNSPLFRIAVRNQ